MYRDVSQATPVKMAAKPIAATEPGSLLVASAIVRRSSLRRRLAALICALFAVLGGAFSWMAYREVVHVLRANASEQIALAAAHVAELLSQSASGRNRETQRMAADPALVHIFRSHQVPPLTSVPDTLRTFMTRNSHATLYLYATDRRAPWVLRANEAPAGGASASLPVEGVGPLRVKDGSVLYTTTAPIQIDTESGPVGYLVVERALGSNQAMSLLERLIGSGATLKLGNDTGDVWTDFAASVASPPRSEPRQPATYVNSAGERRLGMSVPIAGTPWLVWTEISEAAMLQPAPHLLKRMLPISAALMLFGGVAVYALTAGVMSRLEQLTGAAEAIAAGDFSRRVPVDRPDEVGRLAATLNTMAARIGESHEALERRVEARTQELERARQEQDHFFSVSLELLCIAGVDGRFRRVNPAWAQVLGWSTAELTARPYLELVHPDDRASTETQTIALEKGHHILAFENRYRCKDGSYRWLSWKAAPLPGTDVVYAAARDVTEQKQAARALEMHALDLANANRELEAFSYSVSHDLRSPLRSIDGFAQALLEDYHDRLDDTGQDFLSRIRAAAQRMGTLIDDLLSLSRVSRFELVRTDVDLSAMAQELARRLQDSDPARRVDWRISPNLKACVDTRLVRVALENLFANAWKFTSKQEHAVIEFARVAAPNGSPRYVVRDNGAGFDMAHAGKLFRAFQRLHGPSEFPGTGIGLATVQRAIRRHGGSIWASGSVGGGAAFEFTLEERPDASR